MDVLVGHIGWGSTASLGGGEIYQTLKDKGYPLEPYHCPIVLADNQSRTVEVIQLTVEVELAGHLCMHPLILIPSFKDTPVLLGLDFLEHLGICINHHDKVWWVYGAQESFPYRGNPDLQTYMEHPLLYPEMTETVPQPQKEPGNLHNHLVQCETSIQLRGEEAVNLNVTQRGEVDNLLVCGFIWGTQGSGQSGGPGNSVKGRS